jgi:hypothetical protein
VRIGYLACFVLIVKVAFAAPLKNTNPDVTLTLTNVSHGDVSVTFDPDLARTVNAPPLQLLPQMKRSVNTHHRLRLYCDIENISEDKFGRTFNYRFILASEDLSRWWEINETVRPTSKFIDRLEAVTYSAKAADLEDEGTIELPMHSSLGIDLIKVVPKSSPAPINISGGSAEVDITNLSPDLGIRLDPPIVQMNSENWNTVPSISILPVEAGSVSKLSIPLSPRRMKALFATFQSIKPETVHDTVRVTFYYASQYSGIKRKLDLDVNVHFEPSYWSLMAVLLAGAVFGVVLIQFFGSTWEWPAFRKKLVQGILVTVLTELFAFLLVAGGSKFVLFKFELAPDQVLSAFFIGVLGGAISEKVYRQIMEKLGVLQKKNPATGDPNA